eukprot:425470-Pyramimonas_sp.AAC.1
MAKPPARFEDEGVDVLGATAPSPKDLQMWGASGVSQQGPAAVLARVRQLALDAPSRPSWTLDTFDQALCLQPDKGRG